jgi:hypothetical protein
MPYSKNKKKDGSLAFFHVESAAEATEDAASAYQAQTLLAAGASVQSISIFSAMLHLPMAFLYTRLPWLMSKIGSRRAAVLSLCITDALTWLPLVILLFWIRPVLPVWLIAVWVINLMPGALLVPVRDAWLADKVPTNTVGRYLGIRTAIATAAYLSFFFMMGILLQKYQGQTLVCFGLIGLTAFCSTILKAIMYFRIKDIPGKDNKAKTTVNFSLPEFLEETRERGLGRFVLFVSVYYYAVALCSPLFEVYMVKYLHFSYTTFAIILASDFIAKVISAPFWGRYCDKAYNIPLIGKLGILIPFIPILWIFSHNIIYLVIIQFCSGVLWAGFDVCSRTVIYKNAPPDKRPGYIIYRKSITALCQAAGAFSGVLLLGILPPVFGNVIFSMFLVSSAVRFLLARNLLSKVRIREKHIEEAYVARTPRRGRKAPWHGVYSNPDGWPAYMERRARESSGKALTAARKAYQFPAPQPALYYQPDTWYQAASGVGTKPGPKKRKTSAAEMNVPALYYIPGAYDQYKNTYELAASPVSNRMRNVPAQKTYRDNYLPGNKDYLKEFRAGKMSERDGEPEKKFNTLPAYYQVNGWKEYMQAHNSGYSPATPLSSQPVFQAPALYRAPARKTRDTNVKEVKKAETRKEVAARSVASQPARYLTPAAWQAYKAEYESKLKASMRNNSASLYGNALYDRPEELSTRVMGRESVRFGRRPAPEAASRSEEILRMNYRPATASTRGSFGGSARTMLEKKAPVVKRAPRPIGPVQFA